MHEQLSFPVDQFAHSSFDRRLPSDQQKDWGETIWREFNLETIARPHNTLISSFSPSSSFSFHFQGFQFQTVWMREKKRDCKQGKRERKAAQMRTQRDKRGKKGVLWASEPRPLWAPAHPDWISKYNRNSIPKFLLALPIFILSVVLFFPCSFLLDLQNECHPKIQLGLNSYPARAESFFALRRDEVSMSKLQGLELATLCF